jgi:OOP family OmpA-OmpF porin
MKKTAIALALAAGLAAAPAFAQSAKIGELSNWYAGAGIGGGNLNKSGQDLTGLSNVSLDKSDTTYTVRMGYRFNPAFALEAGFYDLGEYAFTGKAGAVNVTGSGKAKSFGLSAVGIAPLGDAFELYGRVGVEQSEIKVNANTYLASAASSDTQTGATYGVGGRYLINKYVGIFAEWMKNDRIQVDSYLIGVDFRF